MMFLIIYSKAGQQELDSQLRSQVRKEHLDRLRILQDQNKLLVGGPFPPTDNADPATWAQHGGFTGGMVIAEFDSLHAAEEWAAEDPYVKYGVFGGPVIVKPWYQTVGMGVEFGRGS